MDPTRPSAQVIALIEFGQAHAECLYSQCRFLIEAGWDVHLIVHPQLLARVAGYATRCVALPVADEGLLGAIHQERAVAAHIRRHAIRHVVVNTASGWAYRLLTLHLARQVRMVAVMHDLDRLRRSFVQRTIARRLSAVLVLAQRLEEPCRRLGGLPVSSFYPAWFPAMGAADLPAKPDGERWFAVVGQIECKRRSYDGLIAAAERGLDPRVRVLVLGRPSGEDGVEVVRRLRASPSGGRFLIPDGFIADAVLHGLLARCDGLLPLVEGRERYVRAAVSGSFNLAYGHGLPLLVQNPIGDPAGELGRHAVMARTGEDLHGLLTRVCDDPSLLQQAASGMRGDDRLSFASSQRRYLGAVLG